jgi:ketosteroid isomerase-like protein
VQASLETEDQIIQVIRRRLDAVRRGEGKSYASYFVDDSTATSNNGALLKPEQIAKVWAHDLHAGTLYKGSEPLHFQVHVYGDKTVASSRIELEQDWEGRKLFVTSRFTDVFAWPGGPWLLVAHHETPIPNARRLAAKVNGILFEGYTGEYQVTPNRSNARATSKWNGGRAMWGMGKMGLSRLQRLSPEVNSERIFCKGRIGHSEHPIIRNGLGDLIAKKFR